MIDVTGLDRRIVDIEEIKSLNLPIFIWGGKHTGKVIKKYLKENGIKKDIRYVVDDEYYIENEDLIPLSQYISQYANDSVMIFGFYNYKIIQNKRKEYGDRIKHLFDFHITSLGYNRVKWDKQDVIRNIVGYENTYSLLKDDFSRKTMQLFLRAAVNGEFDNLFNLCYSETSYFNDVTLKQDVDILIDCGAFDGDSIHDFVDVFQEYEKIYAFEPDSKNRGKLVQRVIDEKIEHVEIVPYGVYNENTTLKFSDDGKSSSIFNGEGGIAIEVVTIDDYVKNKLNNKRVLIKMDIEGTEMYALEGAKDTIADNHPCLAICVYHKECDLIDIPQYINNLVGDGVYDYFLRFHGLDLAELVFYAVPKKYIGLE